MEARSWISWEDHRRSRELARAFGAIYHPMTFEASRWVKYPVLSAKTLSLLIRQKPGVVFSQNPSLILAALLCLFKPIFGYRLFIDRHSNFKLETLNRTVVKWRVFHYLSRFTLKNADLTIVTNDYLGELVQRWGGRPFVLQDKLPNMGRAGAQAPAFMVDREKAQVMFVTTFSEDEPVEDILLAKQLVPEAVFYLTGNYANEMPEARRAQLIEQGVVLTGFVSESDYVKLMSHSDLVVVLTTAENLLTCGAYEALAMGKPMVLSSKEAMKRYFSKGAVYVGDDHRSIAGGVREALSNLAGLQEEVEKFVPELKQQWQVRFNELAVKVENATKPDR